MSWASPEPEHHDPLTLAVWLIAELLWKTEHRLTKKLEKIMANQDQLDAYVAELNDAVAVIAGEIQGLKDQLAALPTEVPVDFTGLDAAVHAVEALEPPAAEPTA